MTHAEFEYELVEALNMLLEDERASVEMEVALASGATEYTERDALAAMGMEDIRFCALLREEMEHAGLPVTPQINGIVFQVIDAERYDDRLRAFARHQRAVAERASELQESNLDGGLREALEGITATHERHTLWTEQRADAFASTRSLEFGAATHGPAPATESAPGADAPAEEDEPEASAPETMTQQTPLETPGEADQEVVEEGARKASSEADREKALSSAEQSAETTAEEAAPAKSQPKPRATRAARTTAPTKAAAKTTAKSKAAAKPKATSTATTTTRRTRRAPAEKDASEV